MTKRWNEQFLSIVALHRRPLLRFFSSRLPDASEAPDFVQEVYLRMLRVDRPDLIRSPEGYLFTIAAHLAQQHWIKRSAQPPHIALEETPTHELPADVDIFETAMPEDAVLRADRMQQLEQVMATLSPKARATLLWHRRDGLTYKEIGARLGISTNMVKKYLAQSLAHCRNHLASDDVR
jgi:RNA polymerase sigma-70 factor (ECF subfamily)